MLAVRVVLACALVLVVHIAGLPARGGKGDADYLEKRARLVEEGQARRFDAGIKLTAKEMAVNTSLCALKQKHMGETPFLPAVPFVLAKSQIANSELYSVLRGMPKGGVLHLHWDASVGVDWLIKNATYRPHCYLSSDGEFRFASTKPGSSWELVSELREQSGDARAFDQSLIDSIIVSPKAFQPYNVSQVWAVFQSYFSRVDGLVAYKPVLEDYFTFLVDLLVQKENVQYLELRAMGETVMYDLKREYSALELATALKEISDRGQKKYPSFNGYKLIFNEPRMLPDATVEAAMDTTIELRKSLPSFVVGFDLVGEEDPGETLLYWSDALLAAQDKAVSEGTTLPLYLHAGETSHYNDAADNLFDAVLLGKRIGHGLGLAKKQSLIDHVKRQNMSVEVCPISNQILQYVSDLRDHPATTLLAEGVAITLSPDDPAVLGSEGVTFDWWVAFVAWDMDLASLKQLALNSLEYSAMTDSEKTSALRLFNSLWDAWIDATFARTRGLVM